VGVLVAVPTNSTSAADFTEAEILEEKIEQIPRASSNPVANRQASQIVNVQSFVRPPVPSSIAPQPQLRDPINTLADGPMGKLASAQGSKRPGLISQHQLATPAPTSASNSNSNSKSSLTQSYARSLQDKTGRFKQIVVMTDI
jgi:bloom syndrome protein